MEFPTLETDHVHMFPWNQTNIFGNPLKNDDQGGGGSSSRHQTPCQESDRNGAFSVPSRTGRGLDSEKWFQPEDPAKKLMDLIVFWLHNFVGLTENESHLGFWQELDDLVIWEDDLVIYSFCVDENDEFCSISEVAISIPHPRATGECPTKSGISCSRWFKMYKNVFEMLFFSLRCFFEFLQFMKPQLLCYNNHKANS